MQNFVMHFYQHVRDSLLWLVVYFIMQALIWIGFGIIIWLYPQALKVFVCAALAVLTITSLYLAAIVGHYVWKLKRIKNLITGECKWK